MAEAEEDSASKVRVVTRFRPHNSIEDTRGGKPCIRISDDNCEVFVKVWLFTTFVFSQKISWQFICCSILLFVSECLCMRLQRNDGKDQRFTFDKIFAPTEFGGELETQDDVFKFAGKPIIDGLWLLGN